MSSNHTRGLMLRLCRIVALLGIVAASLVCAGVASAVDDDPEGELEANAQPGGSIHALLPRALCPGQCRCGSRRPARWR